jgi:precorrin-2 dehydrogenase/sirohydrochlorin ferrochelatase
LPGNGQYHSEQDYRGPVPVEPAQYPVNLVLEGRACLVVGGGQVAARKVAGLLACKAKVTVIAPQVCPELRGEAVVIRQRGYQPGDVAGFRLVITATDDPAVNRAVFEEGDALGIWVNAADQLDACSFTLPALFRRGPILLTVATGGNSPALSGWLRNRVADQVGPEYVELVEMLSEARAQLKAAGRSTEDLDWDSILESDLASLIRAGHLTVARERLLACLSL